jgi:hypothetical protein
MAAGAAWAPLLEGVALSTIQHRFGRTRYFCIGFARVSPIPDEALLLRCALVLASGCPSPDGCWVWSALCTCIGL